ncbi:hypothetical protein NP493_199g04022 [Ridgeia piscesae]|uniref:SCD domain-containing protein n=1 Tax=Ridgeia piscesae TaxID=27915 RepID=A0AAD9UEG9_RIDPI|nr:hypothetical protein NP493_199g04022 [Ridgeia piscesae]
MPVAQRPKRKSKAKEDPPAQRRATRSLRDDSDDMDQAEPASEISLPEIDDPMDSDFEEPKVTRGKRRGRSAAAEQSYTKKTRKGTAAKEVAKKRVEKGTEDDGSLFDIVRSNKTALSSVVDDWIELYKQDRDTALLDLIQFFIRCSGCKARITAHMYHNLEHTEIIRKMTEEFDEDSGDYPLILPGPQWKKFRSNFCDFIMVLVRQCQYSIIYDQYMMDNVISLLTGLTDSQVRAFRHTSTLAAMKLMTALVDVALNLSINLDHTQRQYEAERQKTRSTQASERLEMLMAKRQEIEENQEEIRNMLTYIFKGVFVHRYRDTQPEIRAICMAEIGVWMKRYPGMFLDDSYLKYVGWTLYDRVGDVRMCCLKCLQPLYESEELAPRLELFTNRFKERITEMTLDKEYDVAVHGVKLVTCILNRYQDDVLNDKDCENVYELVYSSHRAVAQAAGEFLNTKLFSREPDDAAKMLKTKKGKKRSENTPLIRDLVQFFIESELHEHGAYLVDSLWDINDMLKDWECMTDLLLEEPGRGEEPMDDRQETSLIEIMVCCVKQAATGEYPVGRGPNRKLTTREVKQVQEDKTRLTEHFIVALPQLLAKYNVDAEKVANLLQIPLYFDLEIYTTSRQEKQLDQLLRHIVDIVDKHTDSEVLENCSKVLDNLCNEEFAVSGKCNVARSTLVDSLVEKYKEAFQDFFQEGDEPDEDDAYALMASLKRIYAFYCCHDLNAWNLWDSLFSIVHGGHEGNAIPEEIICKAIACCSMAIMWFLSSLDENNPDKAQVKHLKKLLHNFMRTCQGLLYHQRDTVQEEAYITICDMLVDFCRHLASNPVMEPLVYEPDKNVQGQLSGFLNDKVFVEEEDDDMDENQKIEELHKRRNFLAAFCKLVVYNIVNIKMAADMFKYYMKFYNDYGDIIKATLGKSREINKVLTAKTLAISLTQLYTELLEEQSPAVDRTCQAFQSIKELARRFSLSFGLDQIKNRDAVAAMHKEGILFSFTRPEGRDYANVGFLEILSEFTSKLMRQDKKVVLGFLDKQLLGHGGVEKSEGWGALLSYRGGLEHDGTAQQMRPPASRRQAKGAKRRLPVEEDAGVAQGEWMIKETRTPARGQPLTSTVIKRRRVDVADNVDQESVSEQGTEAGSEASSERDFESCGEASQLSWLSSQRRQRAARRRLDTSYTRQRRVTSRHQQSEPAPPPEEDDSPNDAGSIEEFESPPPPPVPRSRSPRLMRAAHNVRCAPQRIFYCLEGLSDKSPQIDNASSLESVS